jgi:DNA mismatch repair ATPase MutS
MSASKRPRPMVVATIDATTDDALPPTPAYLGALFEKGEKGGLAIAFLSAGLLSVCLLPCSSERDLAYTLETSLNLPFPPSSVFCNSALPEVAKAALCGGDGDGGDGGCGAPPVVVLKASAWSLAAAQETLRRLSPSLLGAFSVGDSLLLRCAGGVVAAARAGAGAGGGVAALLAPPPARVTRLPLPHALSIDGATLLALGVFPPPGAPPRGARGAPLCLAHLLDTCASASGSALLRGWLRRPLRALAPLSARHDGVGFFAAAAAAAPEGVAALRRALRGVGDACALRRALGAGVLGLPAWRRLRALAGAHEEASALVAQLLATVAPPARMEAGGVSRGGGECASSAARPAALAALLAPTHAGRGIAALGRALDGVIDWRASGEEGRAVPRCGLSAALDEHRALLAELPARLEALTEAELRSFPGLRGALAYEIMPQLGALAAVHTRGGVGEEPEDGGWERGGGGGCGRPRPSTAGTADSCPTRPRPQPPSHAAALADSAPPGWRLHYSTHDTLFFKTPRADAHDAHYGDLPSVTRDLEAMVLRQLEGVAVAAAAAVAAAGEALAEVDALCALGGVAAGNGWVRPDMCAHAPLLLARCARHPLQELITSPFVGNDVALEGRVPAAGGGGAEGTPPHQQRASLGVLTGANGGGKSVYLRTAGLLLLMAQAGSFVAAEAARIGPADAILSRLPAPHPPAASDAGRGAAASRSAFGADALRVRAILEHATPQSLVLVDEWGKGTGPACGGALLAALARALAAAGPRALLSTHFAEVLTGGLLADAPPGPPPPAVAPLRAEVVLEGGEGEGGGGGGGGAAATTTAVPLFRIRAGIADAAFGVHCARRAGVGERVLRRATEVAACLAGAAGLRAAGRSAAGRAATAARRAVVGALLARSSWVGGGEGLREAVAELLALVEAAAV